MNFGSFFVRAVSFTALTITEAAFAQGLGTLTGLVSDPSGAGISAASVVATEVDTGYKRATATNSEGRFVLPSLRPTRYTVNVEAAGFRRFSQTGITLTADETATVNIRMELGTVTETVTVEATAGQVDVSTPTLRQVVDQARMVELPLNGRNAAELTALVAGAVVAPSNDTNQGKTKSHPGGVAISTNGSRQNQISYRLDGASNLDTLSNVNSPFPFPDALQEFSVQTANYSAEFGENAGGVVNVVTKSGTNAFHGNAFGFLRNAVFNARNFFAAQRDPLKRGQFGGTLGGPIIRDKTFFFAGYQGTRIRSVTGGLNAFVPTPSNIAGDFSAFLSAQNPNNPQGRAVQLRDPVNGQPFPGNQIPTSRFDPSSVALLRYLPQAGGNGSVFFSRPLGEYYDEFLGRVDHSLSANGRLTGRYYWNRFSGDPVFANNNLLTYLDGSRIPTQSATLQENHTLRPNLLNEFRFSYHRTMSVRFPAADVPNLTDLGVQNFWQPAFKAFESFAVTGFFSFGDFPPAVMTRNDFTWSDDVRWVKGRHSFSFGGTVTRNRFDIDNTFMQNGNFTFSGDATGSALPDFMIGKLRFFRQGNGQRARLRNLVYALYAQDNFRVSSRLTLDLGVRWDPAIPWHDVWGAQSQFRAEAYSQGLRSTMFVNAPPGMLFPGDPGVPENGANSDMNNMAGRFGFAYDVFGNGKTSVRGGVGMFYDARLAAFHHNRMVTINPFSTQITVTEPQGPFNNPYQGMTNPFPAPLFPTKDAPFVPPVITVTWDPYRKFITPMVYNWNLTLEQQIREQWVLRAAYVGTRSNYLSEDTELNPAVNIAGSTLGTDDRRPFRGFTSIQQNSYTANSAYHSLQLSLQRRFSRGLTVLVNYTVSKALDDIAVNKNTPTFGLSAYSVLPWYFPNAGMFERGPSDFDHLQRFVASYVWEIPPAGTSRVSRALLGNWTISGLFSAQTGGPITILAGQDRSRTALGKERGVYLGGEAYGPGACLNTAPCVDYLNAGAFALPAIGEFGNVGKGRFRGPGILNWDMGFFKNIPVHENWRLQFRAEFFNMFNRVNLLDPRVSLSAAGFGSIRGASDPRITQLALKIFF